jgi:hypothetical protein
VRWCRRYQHLHRDPLSFFVEEGADKEYALMARRLSAMEERLEDVLVELRQSNQRVINALDKAACGPDLNHRCL